jgi:pimeloyl-[acyl-carrier protein] methyl ester esterase
MSTTTGHALLHRETRGSGPDVALLHGWGLHGGIWHHVAEDLAPRHRVHLLDLPGFGRSGWDKGCGDLEGMARRVAEHLPHECSLVGWSLGGMVALRIALLFPQRVRRLVLVATTPRFVAHRSWPHGVDPATLAGFATHLAKDWRRTVQDFLGLQVRGDEHQLETLRELKRIVSQHGEPNGAALAAGLEILRTVDLRDQLARIRAPTLAISGAYDRLTPPGAGEALAAAIPSARHWLVARAAHAPFLSHRAEFAREVDAFLAAPAPPALAASTTPATPAAP